MQANIDRPNGTKIIIEGTPEEVERVLQLFQQPSADRVSRSPQPKTKQKAKTSLKALILELKEEGFFDEKRTKEDVTHALENGGHFYPDSSIGTRLLELVRDDRKLGRFKEGGKWVYVRRD